MGWLFDQILALVEAGYSEEYLWKLTYPQLKRRLEARRRLLALRRIEAMEETFYGSRATEEAVTQFIEEHS